jgi:lipoprotein signal peptidase
LTDLNYPASAGHRQGGGEFITNIRMVKKSSLHIIFFSLLVLIDQFSKYVIRQTGGFYICNKGIAWGMNLPLFLTLVLSIVLILCLCLLILNKFFNLKFKNFDLIENLKLKIENYYPLIIILSGALSNLIDRIYFGCVIDFIDLKFWPVFNFADIFIVAGVIMLIMQALNIKTTNKLF